MWCQFEVFAFSCIVAANCISDKDGQFGGSAAGSQGSQWPLTEDGQHGFHEGSTVSPAQDHRGTSHHQSITTATYNVVKNSKDSSGRPKGQSDNSESNLHSTEQSYRPAGEPTHSPRPSHEGTHTHTLLEYSAANGEGNNRPASGREPFSSQAPGSSFLGPSDEKAHSSGRPTQQSFHTADSLRPAGFRPDDSAEHSSGQPTGGSDGDKRPSNEMPHVGRPTGGSTYSPLRGQSGHSSVEPKADEFTAGPNEGQSGTSDNKENDKDLGKEEDKDVCFPNLGCFKMGKPWKSLLRPIGPPQGPEKIQTTIHFYSRENLERQKNITVYPQVNMGEVRFDPSKITAVIVHGFSNSGNATWMKDMKNVYLSKVDANVMIVDWGKGAQLLNYLQVAGNTRVVGKQLGLFVKYLIENYGADPGKFHLIGHSLGAQICSYLAKEVPGMARLTALDPAQPGFEGFDSELRLDKTDAEFVDVIHTDARPFIPTLGFGMIAPHGHVDFYMNGGFDQPGCVPPPKKELPSIRNFLDLAKYPVEVIAKTVACPHGRAYEYLIEAFNETEKCIFWGHKADVKNVFKSVTNTVTQGLLKKFTALSTTCSKEDCIPVGFASKKSPLRGVFVVTTANRSPYCISEPGVPPETPPQERKQESFIQKIGKKTGLLG